MFTETDPLHAAAQRENEIVSGIRTAQAADEFARRQRGRRQHRPARLEISAEELEKMVKDFTAARGGVVMCRPAYTVPSSRDPATKAGSG